MVSIEISMTPLFYIFLCLPSLKSAAAINFLYNYCDSNTTTYTANSAYQQNLNFLLSSLKSNSTRESGFYNLTVGRDAPDIVYGLFLCRGNVTQDTCQECVSTAAGEILQRCPEQKTALICYDECTLRYSNRSFFSIWQRDPGLLLLNTGNVSEPDQFMELLGNTMQEIATRAADDQSGKKFATEEANITSFSTIYTLAQCTPDLSAFNCYTCLQTAISYLPICCHGRRGGRVIFPSCNVRYELYPFTGVKKRKKSKWIPLGASLSATIGLALFSACGFFIWRRRNIQEDNENSQEVQFLDLVGGSIRNEHSRENFSEEKMSRSQEFPSIQLDILHAATNHFCDENKLGEGGFGLVYKGTLPDGKEIAVKRLSRTSGQGLLEFKNEVMLIARLQHRNLVRLLGCCLEQNEQLLVYEFMPNRSLDVFLFDSSMAAQLSWLKRFSIIKGIARDFGLARIFDGDQNQANTNRVVGTYGYMAPEYAMEGLFSIKSDVFSFGVLLLEIISGKKNNGFHLSEHGESLLTFAWKLWSKGQGMKLIDQLLVQSCVATEVLKCIHIGLLCVQEDPADRPRMTSVIVMLESETITLPRPAEPAFSVGRVVAEPTEPTSNDRIYSVNEGTLPDGKEIEVKRLSRTFGQGLFEFKNEVMFAKLRHRNLVRLLGCCLEKNEKLLVYGFLPNSSLDVFLFGLILQP
ncbi:Cysteine-rich RLK 10, putative [Theobroma cacao]|uniref:non-specific serine/threonine protein kinase n=1 Tax=Theobroma cacao TaxID=3641 RepID=A0A061GNA2_THECC|nr:Cysteine-rich RLK 10, putative [Theobroma cacao]